MTRAASRNDTAHHRNLHDGRHPLCLGARLAGHLVFAAWRPVRSLEELLREIDRVGWNGDPGVVLVARFALRGALPYLHDKSGEVWR